MMISCALILLLPYFVSSANILVLETVASPSHHIFTRTLTTALAARGHNVTSLSTDIEENTPENLHYLHLDKVYDVLFNEDDEDYDFLKLGQMSHFKQLMMLVDFATQTFKGMIKSKGYHQLKEYPDDFKFDLVIYDFLFEGVLLPFVEKFRNPPVIALTAFFYVEYSARIVGGTLSPAYVPYLLYDGNLNTFWGRLNNFLLCHMDYFLRQYYTAPQINAILQKEFPSTKDIREWNTIAKVVLLNKYPGQDIIEPALPNVISVGGMQIQRNTGLPEEFQQIMESAKEGVILFSLGTNIKSSMLGNARQIEILETFRSLPQYMFIWKFEIEGLPVEIPPNVIIRSFIPQSDLLAHPNLKLFISHCGLLSTQEAAWYGVPILGFPIFADQFQNMRLNLKTGVALQGDIVNVERNSFKKLIEEMLKNPKYRENAKVRSEIFRDQKETPLERAIWWTEFVLRHPNMTFMRSPSLDFVLPVRQSWDVLAFLYSIILLSAVIFIKIVRCIIRSYREESRKTKKE